MAGQPERVVEKGIHPKNGPSRKGGLYLGIPAHPGEAKHNGISKNEKKGKDQSTNKEGTGKEQEPPESQKVCLEQIPRSSGWAITTRKNVDCMKAIKRLAPNPIQPNNPPLKVLKRGKSQKGPAEQGSWILPKPSGWKQERILVNNKQTKKKMLVVEDSTQREGAKEREGDLNKRKAPPTMKLFKLTIRMIVDCRNHGKRQRRDPQ